MTGLKIRFDLTVSPALARWGLAGLLVVASVPDLSSENVTLSTYYPAPSGVYTQMLVSSNTYIARDGGSVGIGGNPAFGGVSPQAKLDVRGNILLTVAPKITFTGVTNLAAPAANVLTIGGAAEWLRLNASDNIGIGTTDPRSKLDVNGSIGYTSAGCSQTAGGCAATEYYTWLPGVNTHFDVSVSPRLGAGANTHWCCPCPTGAACAQ